MSSLLSFINLPIKEKELFFQAIYFLIVFRIKLARTPPKNLFAEIAAEPSFDGREICLSGYVLPSRIVRIINQASRFVPYTTCLSKALVGSVLFSKNCCKSGLHIGVFVNEKRKLEAHAWLSYDGRIVIGDLPDLSKYQELPLMLQESEL
jgi:hypothetical protein